MNDLVKRSSLPTGGDWGGDWGGADSDSKITLRVTIGQKMSEGKEVGKFNWSNNAFPTQAKLINVVVVYSGMTRVLYGETKKSPAKCKSDNFEIPSKFIKNPVSLSCLDCPMSQWNDNKPPICKDTINMICLDEKMIPFGLNFQGSQIKKVRNDLINKVKFMGKRPYQVMFDIELKEFAAPKGSYFENIFTNFRAIDSNPGEMTQYNAYWNQFAKEGQSAISDLHQSMDNEKEVQPAFDDLEEPPF